MMEPLEIAARLAAAVLLLAWSVPAAFDWVPRLLFLVRACVLPLT